MISFGLSISDKQVYLLHRLLVMCRYEDDFRPLIVVSVTSCRPICDILVDCAVTK